MARRLEGKVAIVTGGGRNIGREEAMALARQGAKVLVADIDKAEDTAARIRGEGGEAAACSEDASSWDGCARIVEAAVARFGRLDILVNNAGVVRPQPIHEMTEADWDAVMGVTLKGYAAMIRFAAPHLIAQRGGVIVNTGSTSGLGHLHMANYSAAKEGVLGLTRTVARELGQYGVRCNMVRPSSLDTGMGQVPGVAESSAESRRLNLPTNGLRHIGPGADRVRASGSHVAALVVLLCLPATAGISGQDFFIMGDELARFPEPVPSHAHFKPGGWTLEALEDPIVLRDFLGDLVNRYVRGA